VLLNIASLAELFCSPDGETAYADVTIAAIGDLAGEIDRVSALPGRCYYAQEHKAPTPQAIQEAIAVIERRPTTAEPAPPGAYPRGLSRRRRVRGPSER